jgi:tetratricopeptide (TPR) repeat protein
LAAEAARRTQAEAAERRADSNVALSLKSFEAIFNQIAPRESMPQQRPWAQDDPERDHRPPPPPESARKTSGQDAAVLQSVLDFYDRFAQQNSTNRTLEAEAAKAYRRVGDIYLRMGRTADADAANRRSAGIFGQLLQASPNSTDFQASFADAVTGIGYPQAKPQPGDQAMLDRATALSEGLVKAFPQDPDFTALLARTLFRQGMALRQTGDSAAAEKMLRQSAAAWAAEKNSRRPGHRFPPPQPAERSAVLQALAELLIDTNRAAEARATMHEVFDELDRAANGPARGPNDRAATAGLLDRLAQSAIRAGESELADRARDRAGQLRTERRPDIPQDGPPRLPPSRRP